MEVSGLPFDIDDANKGCDLYYEQALPLVNEQKYQESVPILIESLRILARCSAAVGKDHPRMFNVWRTLVQSLEETGHATVEAEDLANQIVNSARDSTQLHD